MSMLSRAAKKVVSKPLATALSPVTGGIEAVTGLSPQAQFAMGAGVGSAATAYGAVASPAAGAATPAAQPSVSLGSRQPDVSASGFNYGSLIAPALGTAGSIYGAMQNARSVEESNAMNVDIAREQMQFSASQAQREMEFQERMSGTAYQRVTDDMRKAGINPMLAIDNGGASTPGGAMGSSAGATMAPIPSVVANSMSSAMDLIRTYAEARRSLSASRLDDKQADISSEHLPEAKFQGKFWRFINGMVDRVSAPFSGKRMPWDGIKTRNVTDITNDWMNKQNFIEGSK